MFSMWSFNAMFLLPARVLFNFKCPLQTALTLLNEKDAPVRANTVQLVQLNPLISKKLAII